MPPFLLSERSPSASVPQGSFGLICVGRFVLLVSLAPLVAVSSRWWAPLGCLLLGRLMLLKAAGRLWQCALPCLRLMPRKAAPWWPSPPDYLVPGLPGPLKALAASWRRAPLVLLLQGLLVPWKAAARSWRRAVPLGCGLPGLRVSLKVLMSPWWQPPPDCLAPGRLGTLKTAEAP